MNPLAKLQLCSLSVWHWLHRQLCGRYTGACACSLAVVSLVHVATSHVTAVHTRHANHDIEPVGLSLLSAQQTAIFFPAASRPLLMLPICVSQMFSLRQQRCDCFSGTLISTVLQETADLVAGKTDWAPLYNSSVLAKNTVPVASATYFEVMHLPSQRALSTASCAACLILLCSTPDDALYLASCVCS